MVQLRSITYTGRMYTPKYDRPSAGIGDRLKRYRLLSGLSAQKLSDELDGAISRGVIANIEAGTKRDVTVDELIQLAYALDIPPVMLALPVEEPNENVLVYRGLGVEDFGLVSSSYRLVRWFSGENVFKRPLRPARVLATSILRALDDVETAMVGTRAAQDRAKALGSDNYPPLIEAWTTLEAAIKNAQALGISHGEDPLL